MVERVYLFERCFVLIVEVGDGLQWNEAALLIGTRMSWRTT